MFTPYEKPRAHGSGGSPLRGVGHQSQRLHQPRRSTGAEHGQADERPGDGPTGWGKDGKMSPPAPQKRLRAYLTIFNLENKQNNN